MEENKKEGEKIRKGNNENGKKMKNKWRKKIRRRKERRE